MTPRLHATTLKHVRDALAASPAVTIAGPGGALDLIDEMLAGPHSTGSELERRGALRERFRILQHIAHRISLGGTTKGSRYDTLNSLSHDITVGAHWYPDAVNEPYIDAPLPDEHETWTNGDLVLNATGVADDRNGPVTTVIEIQDGHGRIVLDTSKWHRTTRGGM